MRRILLAAAALKERTPAPPRPVEKAANSKHIGGYFDPAVAKQLRMLARPLICSFRVGASPRLPKSQENRNETETSGTSPHPTVRN